MNIYPVLNNTAHFELIEPHYEENINVERKGGIYDKTKKRLKIGYAIKDIGEYLEKDQKLTKYFLTKKQNYQKKILNKILNLKGWENEDPIISLAKDIEKIL